MAATGTERSPKKTGRVEQEEVGRSSGKEIYEHISELDTPRDGLITRHLLHKP